MTQESTRQPKETRPLRPAKRPPGHERDRDGQFIREEDDQNDRTASEQGAAPDPSARPQR